MTALAKEIGIPEILRQLEVINAKIDALSDATPQWLTIEQVAEMRGKSPETIRRYIRNGKLSVDGRRMIHRDDA